VKKLRSSGSAILLFLSIKATSLLILLFVSHIRGIRFAHIFSRWDAQWYRRIAENGYGHIVIAADGRHLSDYAFFPLYPMLERLIHSLTGMSFISSGLLISVISSILAVVAIFTVVKSRFSDRFALITVALWTALPVGLVTTLAYSEALFTALAAFSILKTIEKRWITASLLAALAGLTRPTGLAVALSVIFAAVLHLKESKFDLKAWLAILIAPLGWLSYMAFVARRVGSWNGYFLITSDWGNSIDGGVSFFKWILHFFSSGKALEGVLIVGALAILIYLIVDLWSLRVAVPILIYSLAIVVLALITSGYFGSKYRYLLPVFPLLMPLSKRIASLEGKLLLSLLVALTLTSSFIGALWLTGSGPL